MEKTLLEKEYGMLKNLMIAGDMKGVEEFIEDRPGLDFSSLPDIDLIFDRDFVDKSFSLPIAKMILDSGVLGRHATSPRLLRGAVSTDDTSLVYELLKRGVKPESHSLCSAVNFRREGLAGILLAAGADPNAMCDDWLGRGRFTLLNIALSHYDQDMAKLLLEHGAELKEDDVRVVVREALNRDPYNKHVRESRKALLKIVLDAGARIDNSLIESVLPDIPRLNPMVRKQFDMDLEELLHKGAAERRFNALKWYMSTHGRVPGGNTRTWAERGDTEAAAGAGAAAPEPENAVLPMPSLNERLLASVKRHPIRGPRYNDLSNGTTGEDSNSYNARKRKFESSKTKEFLKLRSKAKELLKERNALVSAKVKPTNSAARNTVKSIKPHNNTTRKNGKASVAATRASARLRTRLNSATLNALRKKSEFSKK